MAGPGPTAKQSNPGTEDVLAGVRQPQPGQLDHLLGDRSAARQRVVRRPDSPTARGHPTAGPDRGPRWPVREPAVVPCLQAGMVASMQGGRSVVAAGGDGPRHGGSRAGGTSLLATRQRAWRPSPGPAQLPLEATAIAPDVTAVRADGRVQPADTTPNPDRTGGRRLHLLPGLPTALPRGKVAAALVCRYGQRDPSATPDERLTLTRRLTSIFVTTPSRHHRGRRPRSCSRP